MDLELKNISKSYNGNLAVDDISLEVSSGEILALVGPSGCGKTTVLRVVAGLVLPDRGSVTLGGQDITRLPANRRPTVTVFQDYALFPHLNVLDNIAYGLKTRRVNKREILPRVEQVMDLMRIRELGKRRIHELSGGQQQRVAVARSLVVNPGVMLFDEPLSSLDARLRVQMREEIKRIQQQTGITALYVTHDQEEALAIADRVAVMQEGRVDQVGTPEEVYRLPGTRFVGKFIGWGNLVEARVLGNSPSSLQLEMWQQPVRVSREEGSLRAFRAAVNQGGKETGVNGGDYSPGDPAPGVNRGESREKPETLTLFFRPESVVLDPSGPWSGEVLQKTFLGSITRYQLRVEGQRDYDSSIMLDLSIREPALGVGDKINFNLCQVSVIENQERL